MIKASSKILLKVYNKLFNFILSSGIFPDMWCKGLITPIFKSGDSANPENYRGICVSSCMGKLFWMILLDRLSNFTLEKEILHPSQIERLTMYLPLEQLYTSM